MKILILLLLVSCASKESQVKEYCNDDGAYAKGYSDGKRNLTLDSDPLSMCKSKKFNRLYKEGYFLGQELFSRTPPEPTGFGATINNSLPRKCVLRFLGDSFLGEGYSFGDAQQNGLEKCQRVHGSKCGGICENLPSN